MLYWILLCCLSITSLVSDVEGISDYEYHSKARGWLKTHNIAATWIEALYQCHREGAVLASPLHYGLLDVMIKRIGQSSHCEYSDNNNIVSYFIGAHSKFSARQYVSVEGIPLGNMPVMNMAQILNPEDGNCLKMNNRHIEVVSCGARLPYMCYKKRNEQETMTECGTFDKAYRYNSTTGSCYKLHREFLPWAEANSVCIAEGGYLVILNSEQEANLVTTMIPDIAPPNTNTSDRSWDPLFIGLVDWNKQSYFSIHGEPVEEIFNSWPKDQPDSNEQHCGALLRSTLLDNVHCNSPSFFVCEKDPKNIKFNI